MAEGHKNLSCKKLLLARTSCRMRRSWLARHRTRSPCPRGPSRPQQTSCCASVSEAFWRFCTCAPPPLRALYSNPSHLVINLAHTLHIHLLVFMALWMWPKATNNFSKTQQALEGLALLTACCRQGAARSAIVFHHIYRYCIYIVHIYYR